jgi:hypothetical protein
MQLAEPERCPFAFLTVESASVASPPKKYSLGNDFVLVFSETTKAEIVRSDMSSEKAVFKNISVPCPAGKTGPGLRVELLQMGVYDAPTGVQQGVATLAWSKFQTDGPITVPMSKGPVRSCSDDGENVKVQPVLTMRVKAGTSGGGELGETALAAASRQFNTRLVDAKSDADRELHTAAGAGDLDKVKALLPQATSVCVLWPTMSSGDLSGGGVQTPLHRAAKSGHVAVVNFLLESGSAVDATVERGGGGKSALYRAAEGGHLEVVKALLAAGATDIESNSGKKCSQVGSRPIKEAILDSFYSLTDAQKAILLK